MSIFLIKNYGEKYILIIHVAQGTNSPYYISSMGISFGIYVRLGSIDRVATIAQIEELKLRSRNLSFSNSVYYDNNRSVVIPHDDIQELLSRLNTSGRENVVNLNKLLEWQVVLEEFGKTIASNAYMLLTSNPFPNAYIKIGIFGSDNRADLIHEEYFKGSIIDQYIDVTKRIQELLDKGYNFQNQRFKEYDVPEIVIQEIISNAIIHRSYYDDHPIRIEIYPTKLTVFSPGTLYDGLQLQDILEGISKLRNLNIAEVFYFLGFAEKWGTGIQRSNTVLYQNSMEPLNIDTDSIHGVTVTIYFEKIIENQSRDQNDVSIIGKYTQNDKQFKQKI